MKSLPVTPKPAPILEPGASAPANATDSRLIRALPFLTHGACWFTFSLMLLVLRSSKDEVRAWLTVAMIAIVAIPYAVWFKKINRTQKPRVLVALIALTLSTATSVGRTLLRNHGIDSNYDLVLGLVGVIIFGVACATLKKCRTTSSPPKAAK